MYRIGNKLVFIVAILLTVHTAAAVCPSWQVLRLPLGCPMFMRWTA